MWGVCRCFWCFGLGYKEEWSGGVRERGGANFERTGVLEMSHRGCMHEESGGNSPELGVALVVRNSGRSGVGGSERGTHRGCTATTAKSPEPGKTAELWAFCAWGVFSWTWNAMWGVCCCFWCFGLGYKEEWSGGVRERAWGTVDAVRGEWEAVMWVPEGVGPTGCLPRIFGGDSRWILCSKKSGLDILLVRGDVESKCAEVDWVRSLWFRFDGVMNMY
uniref:Uncharacterized protein n=1 Tax=Oryza rufipogon TaxID=4529 RepID=A0A0E0QHC5_ORYRU